MRQGKNLPNSKWGKAGVSILLILAVVLLAGAVLWRARYHTKTGYTSAKY